MGSPLSSKRMLKPGYCPLCFESPGKHAVDCVYAENKRLRTVLERYTFAYPAFRMKPIGAPGSPARVESERLMELEEEAQKLLNGRGS